MTWILPDCALTLGVFCVRTGGVAGQTNDTAVGEDIDGETMPLEDCT